MTFEEAYSFYTGEIGISPEEFYNSTPHELMLKAEGYGDAIKRRCELQSHATAVAINNALSTKKVPVFEKQDTTQEVTLEEREDTLKYLEERFGG